jgi:hypothetical protein
MALWLELKKPPSPGGFFACRDGIEGAGNTHLNKL